MTPLTHTLTLTLAIPLAVYGTWGTPALAERALKAQGVWPVSTQSARWWIDAESSRYMAELTVRVQVREELSA